jgi:predicted Zn-dependent protease
MSQILNYKKLQDLVKELQGFEELERETELLPLNIHTSTRYYSPFQKSLNTCSDSNNRTQPLFNSI